MLAGWRERGLAPSVVVDPAKLGSAGPEVMVVADAAAIPVDFKPSAVVLAVKPQNAAEVLPQYTRFASSAVILSIMAGQTINGISGLVGAGAAVVRAMPNTPAAIRQGITVCVAGPGVTSDQHALCDALLTAVGLVEWVDKEALLDPVTAVSGGGPAYVFLLAELLEKAAVEQGVPAALARRMARQTIVGSGALLAASSDDAASLRVAVTSPKGTTERALAVLMEPKGLPALLSRAIAAATARSRELAG